MSKSHQSVITIEPLPREMNGDVNGEVPNGATVNGLPSTQPGGAGPIEVAVTIEPAPPPRAPATQPPGDTEDGSSIGDTDQAPARGSFYLAHACNACGEWNGSFTPK